MIARCAFLLAVAAASTLALALHGRIPQDPAYHHFADRRMLLRIPNFWNVISNAGFLFVGVAGLRAMAAAGAKGLTLDPACFVLFVSLIFLSLGSAYYHLAPDNGRLTWDRLPMALAFMAFLAVVIGERIEPHLARLLLPFLLLCGAASVVYWHWSERRGRGDLRPYLLVQFLPLVLIALITLLFPASAAKTHPTWSVLIAYAAAKIAELYDERIFAMGNCISGHTLKHLTAAAGLYLLVLALAPSLT